MAPVLASSPLLLSPQLPDHRFLAGDALPGSGTKHRRRPTVVFNRTQHNLTTGWWDRSSRGQQRKKDTRQGRHIDAEEGRALARSPGVRLPSDYSRRPPSLERQDAFRDARTTKSRTAYAAAAQSTLPVNQTKKRTFRQHLFPDSDVTSFTDADYPETAIADDSDDDSDAELYRLGLLYDNPHERGSGFTFDAIVHDSRARLFNVYAAPARRPTKRAANNNTRQPPQHRQTSNRSNDLSLPLDLSLAPFGSDSALAEYLISPEHGDLVDEGLFIHPATLFPRSPALKSEYNTSIRSTTLIHKLDPNLPTLDPATPGLHTWRPGTAYASTGTQTNSTSANKPTSRWLVYAPPAPAPAPQSTQEFSSPSFSEEEDDEATVPELSHFCCCDAVSSLDHPESDTEDNSEDGEDDIIRTWEILMDDGKGGYNNGRTWWLDAEGNASTSVPPNTSLTTTPAAPAPAAPAAPAQSKLGYEDSDNHSDDDSDEGDDEDAWIVLGTAVPAAGTADS